MKLQAKLFLYGRDKALLGPGRIRLLSLIREMGSLHKAAAAMGMSYRWAWAHIQKTQETLGVALLERKSAARGRSWTLTEEARQLVAWFENARDDMEKTLADMEQSLPPGFAKAARPAGRDTARGAKR